MSEMPAHNPDLPESQATLCGRVLRLGRHHINLEVEGQLRFDVPYRLSRTAQNLTGADSVLFQWEISGKPKRASILIHGPAPSQDPL
jgi:hypothetical protein